MKLREILCDLAGFFVMAVSLITALCVFQTKRHNQVPSLFGISLVTVGSGSMEASGFFRGDTVLIKKKRPSALRIGDFIAFYRYTNAESSEVLFHQIIQIAEEDGSLWFQTQGTSNDLPDARWVNGEYVIGAYVECPLWIRNCLSFLGSRRGVITLVLIPQSVLLFLLCLQTIGIVDSLLLERKVLSGKLELTSRECRKKNIGPDMTKKQKRLVLEAAPEDKTELYRSILYPHKISQKNRGAQ